MPGRRAIPVAVAALALIAVASVESTRAQIDDSVTSGGGIEQKLELTPAQRSAIYTAVSKDKSKVAPQQFSTVVGADVPDNRN